MQHCVKSAKVLIRLSGFLCCARKSCAINQAPMYLQQEKLLFEKGEAKRFPASELLHPIGWGFSHRDRSLSSIVNEPMHNEKRDFYGRAENFSYSRPELLSPLLSVREYFISSFV